MAASLDQGVASREQPIPIVKSSPFDEFVRRHGTIPRRGMFGYFVHEFGRRIVSGAFPPGTTLPNEPELVDKFGISRTVVREAMKCLAGKGLVDIRTRVGTRVRERRLWHHLDIDVMVWYCETSPSADIMRSIGDIRRAIEPEAAVRAARRATEADIGRIAAALREIEAAIGDPNAAGDADLDFHAAIFAATHNPFYAQMVELIAVAIYATRTTLPPAQIVSGQTRTLPLHKAVHDAIAAHDAEGALTASRRLVESWRYGREAEA